MPFFPGSIKIEFSSQPESSTHWSGSDFKQPIEPVIALQQLVEKVCLAHNLEPEKKIFTPHFTIGRVRQRAEYLLRLENDIEACSFHTARFIFAAVRIMESTLNRNDT